MQGSKIVLVRSYLRVSQAAGQVNILIFLMKIKFSPCIPINFVMQGKCLFSDISRPVMGFLWSFMLLLAHCTECYKLSMSIMSTIFDVSIREKRVYGR